MASMMTLLNYGERWRKHRQLMQTSFGQEESIALRPDIRKELDKFILDLTDSEGDIRSLIHQ